MKEHFVELDRKREIRFGFKAMRAVEAKFGKKAIENIGDMATTEMPALLLIGLQWEDKTLTLAKLEEMIDDTIPKINTIASIVLITLAAVGASLGVEFVKKQTAGEKKKKRQSRAGGSRLQKSKSHGVEYRDHSSRI